LQRSAELLERHFAGELDYYECECRMRHKDGRWVWVLDCGRAVSRDGDGKALMMFGTHADITERTEMQAAACQSRLALLSLLENQARRGTRQHC
jgi:PAS domain S-box-containing protein